jgi:hypothetical protein
MRVHCGGAGSLVMVDLDARLTVAYVLNQLLGAGPFGLVTYLMATALADEPIPPGAFIGALTRNIS